MPNYLIFGATSAIAIELARLLAKRPATMVLVGRDSQKLAVVAADITVRQGKVAGTIAADLADIPAHDALFAEAERLLGSIDCVVIAHGTLPDPDRADPDYALAQFAVNGTSAISLGMRAAQGMERAGAGMIVVIGSVAGERGRQSNYLYGAAKGAVNIYFQGLRNRLFHKRIHVLTVKPGFVDTPMTAHLPKNFLFASPSKVAADVLRAMDNRRDVLFTPWFWRWIMLAVRLVPERIFKKLKL